MELGDKFFESEISKRKKQELSERKQYERLVQELAKNPIEQEKEFRRIAHEKLAERRKQKEALVKAKNELETKANKKSYETQGAKQEISNIIIDPQNEINALKKDLKKYITEQPRDLKNPIPLDLMVKKILKMRHEYQGNDFATRLFCEGFEKLEAELAKSLNQVEPNIGPSLNKLDTISLLSVHKPTEKTPFPHSITEKSHPAEKKPPESLHNRLSDLERIDSHRGENKIEQPKSGELTEQLPKSGETPKKLTYFKEPLNKSPEFKELFEPEEMPKSEGAASELPEEGPPELPKVSPKDLNQSQKIIENMKLGTKRDFFQSMLEEIKTNKYTSYNQIAKQLDVGSSTAAYWMKKARSDEYLGKLVNTYEVLQKPFFFQKPIELKTNTKLDLNDFDEIVNALKPGKIQDLSKYRCSHCSFSTTYNFRLREHLGKNHNKKLIIYGCPLCEYQTKHQSWIKLHLIETHYVELLFPDETILDWMDW